MRRIFAGSSGLAALIFACSSFNGEVAAVPSEAGPADDASQPDIPDAAADAPFLVPHAKGKWMVGVGSRDTDDSPAGLAWSGNFLYLSMNVGSYSFLGADSTGDGGGPAFKGIAVVKLRDDNGAYGGAVYNFAGADSVNLAAGPIAATSAGVFASGTSSDNPSDHNVSLRRLGSSDLALVSTVDVHNVGDQIVYAATADGLGAAVYALQVNGTTSVSTGGFSAVTTPRPGVVSAFGAVTVTDFFTLGADTKATPSSVAIDANDRIVVGGWYEGRLANDAGSFGPPAATGEDGFVARFDRSGNFLDSAFFGGASSQRVTSVATDTNIRYVAGTFVGSLASGSRSLPAVNGTHAFAARIDDANEVKWLVDVGEVSAPFVGLAVDGSQVVVTGTFQGKTTIGPATLESKGGTDVFLANLDRDTGGIRSADAFGRENPEVSTAFTTDKNGQFFLTGTFSGATSLDGTAAITAQGSGTDVFVLAVSY